MMEDNKKLFRDILTAFLDKHSFDLPALPNEATARVSPSAAAAAATAPTS
jgi:hypothetical protein